MSEWYWRVIALKAAFVLTCLASYLKAEEPIQKLPYCNPDRANDPTVINDLLIVSTLDGRVTAFATDSGAKAWDVQTAPLLNSNLHHVELTAGGKWVRLIPSLRGTLYSLTGDTIEPLPFNAEQLLSSSFKYSEDLVIAGARESVWMGVDAVSGRVMYTCGSQGCTSEQETAGAGKDVLVLRRNSNVVRALEPRTGTEKWNFSVAEHQLAVSGGRECAGTDTREVPETGHQIHVRVPEAMLIVRGPQDHRLLWEHKLEAPVAGLWRLRAGSLQSVDALWSAARSLSSQSFVQATPPSLYIGLHNQQLYVQEGLLYVQKSETAVATRPVPWKLRQTRPLITGPETALQETDNSLSLVALYRNNGQGGNFGYFLYSEQTCDQGVQVTEDLLDSGEVDIVRPYPEGAGGGEHAEEHHVHVHVYSLWYWWKEVLLIAVSSALLMNLMIWPRFFAPRIRPSTPIPVNQDVIVVERHYESPPRTPEYSGRYESDFTQLRCLGSGGFGVVFQVRNNIDHCNYAVKRITLPRRESKRERVLREVRALAKLEHEHIVRYFNAWLEEPPPDWQEQRDKIWMRELEDVSVAMHDDFTSIEESRRAATAGSVPRKHSPSVMLNLQKPDWQKPIDACIDAIEFEQRLREPAKRNRSKSFNDSFSIIFDDKSTKNLSAMSKSSIQDTIDVSGVSILDKIDMSKNLGAGDNDDSFIVFANSQDMNHNSKGLSEARNDESVNLQLEKVDNFTTESETSKKKKGHTRHLSLDKQVVVGVEQPAWRGNKMYLYIQMQLCMPDSLHDWLRQNSSYHHRGKKAIDIFRQIVSAVEYVHRASLIHRDLKPSNIFFAPDGKVKVGDFGLVTAMTDTSQDETQGYAAQTKHTNRVGTHLYMSPEQLKGLPYSYKVDIYSLGVILFELLQPFHTEAERVGRLQDLRACRYPDNFHHNYPLEVETLTLMLSPDPEQRPTAAEVSARAPLHPLSDSGYLPPQYKHSPKNINNKLRKN